MSKLVIFSLLSLMIILISRRTLLNTKSHGFYRFFSWECIALLFSVNFKFWFVNPFGIAQIVSWIFLIYSAYLALAGIIILKKKGEAQKSRDEKELFEFERTTELIDTGVFKRIRHPLYSSLLFLTWAIYLKNPIGILFIVGLFSTVFLYLTSKFDEKECLNYFGEEYRDYMKRTKMFIPFVF